MTRRRKSSPAEDVTDLIALLPWWVGVALALVSYLILSTIAAKPVSIPTQPGQMSGLVTHAIWKGLATGGQYIVPLICLLGAGLSAIKRQQRKRLVNDTAQSQAADALNGMRWQEFEILVGEAFRLKGFLVAETGGGGADGGIDLVLSKPVQNGREKYLVQCKQWRALKVGVDVVRELYGAMAAHGAAGGYVVTSGRYTPEALRFAEGRNVTLIDGPQLQRMIREARGASGAPRPSPPAAKPPSAVPPMHAATADRSLAPECPQCGNHMLKRTARRGGSTGNRFWGCSAFPACRGTRPMT